MSYLKVQKKCIHPYLESVPVWLAVTPLQRHWEGSASRSNRSAGASVEIYIDWEHCPQALQYSSFPPLPPSLPSSFSLSPSSPPGLSNVVSTLQSGCNITTYTILAKVRLVMASCDGGWRWHFSIIRSFLRYSSMFLLFFNHMLGTKTEIIKCFIN